MCVYEYFIYFTMIFKINDFITIVGFAEKLRNIENSIILNSHHFS